MENRTLHFSLLWYWALLRPLFLWLKIMHHDFFFLQNFSYIINRIVINILLRNYKIVARCTFPHNIRSNMIIITPNIFLIDSKFI